jgi:glycosyltransferase involved in cell wall biosynthesis
MMEPLVSIGIPTYNRPNGLRRALEHITRQSYKNLEIIVSDNASPGTETRDVGEEFAKSDPRVKYFRQDINKGASFNFMFVLEKSTANYFMWAADDDYFESENLVERLVEKSADKVLSFPDFNLLDIHGNITSGSILKKTFGDCQSNYDYLFSFCKSGAGYPVYGLYNLSEFYKHDLSFEFDGQLIYFNEGTFLHRIFSTDKIVFVPDVFIDVTESGSLPPNKFFLLKDFVTYTKKLILMYISPSKLSVHTRFIVLLNIVRSNSISLFNIFIEALRIPGQRKDLLKYVMFDWLFLISTILFTLYLPMYFWQRIKKYAFNHNFL